MAENIRPTPSALEDQREGQDRYYAFISESEIGPLFLGNSKMAENIPPTPSALEYQRGSQSRSDAAMSGIEPSFSLGNAKKVENIPPAPSALEYYRKTQNRSYPPLPNLPKFESRPKKAGELPPAAIEARKKMMGRRCYPSMSEVEPGLFLGNSWSSYDRILLETNDIDAVVSLTDAGHGRWALTRE